MLLIKEALRGTKKNIKKYISLFLFLFFTVAIFSAMITNSIQTNTAIEELTYNSGYYDFEINSSLLTNKYYNIKQDEMSKSSDKIEKSFGDMLSWFNPYKVGSTNYKNYSFYSFSQDLKNTFINSTDPKMQNWTLNQPKIITDNSDYDSASKSIDGWITLILNYASQKLLDHENIYISLDGLNNFILYEIMEDDNWSLMYYSDGIHHPFLNNHNKPSISYVHNFYYTNNFKNKKIYLDFQSINTTNNPEIPYDYNNWTPEYKTPVSNFSVQNFFSREKINKVVPMSKEVNSNLDNNQIMINHQFAVKNKLKLGQTINLRNNSYNPSIVDYASSISNLFPVTQNTNSIASGYNNSGLKDGTYVFLNQNDYFKAENYLINQNNRYSSDCTVYLSFNNKNKYSQNNVMYGNYGLFTSYFINTSNVYYDYNLSPAGQIDSNSKILIFIESSVCIIVVFVVLIVLVFFVKKYIEYYYSKIGILKALGYNNKKIAIIFSSSLSVILSLALFTGFFGSIPFQIFISNTTIYSVGANLRLFYYNIFIILFCFIYLPLLFTSLIYITSIIIVNKNLLLLIYDIPTNKRLKKVKNKIISKKNIINAPFSIRLSFSFVSKSISKWLLVFFISTFAIFILLFQFNVNVFLKNYQDDQFIFFNKNVKFLSSTTIDQLDSAVANKNSTEPDQQFHSFKWISSKDNDHGKITECKFGDESKPININKPVEALSYFLFGIDYNEWTPDKLKDVFGDAANIFYFKKNQYISSVNVKRLINMTMTDPSSPTNKIPLWNGLLNNWDTIQKDIIDFNESIKNPIPKQTLIFYLNTFHSYIMFFNNYSEETHNNYPNIYLGDYMTYDERNEMPVIMKDAEWDSSYQGKLFNIVRNIQFLGLNTDSTNKFNDFFNLNFTNNNLSNVLDDINEKKENIKDEINNPSTSIDSLKNIDIPVIIPQIISKVGNFKINSLIKFDINTLNLPITCKVVAISSNDTSSSYIYTPSDVLNAYIKKYISLKTGITKLPDQYFNTLISKSDNNGNPVLKIFRNLNLFSPKVSDYNYNPPIISSTMNNNPKNNCNSIPPTDLGPFASGYYNNKNSSLSILTSMNSIKSLDLLKSLFSNGFDGLYQEMILSEVTTVIIDIFILFSLISIIFDDNRRIILTLKALGYSTMKVATSILSFYFLVMIIGFPLASLVVSGIWIWLLNFVFLKTGILLISHFTLLYFMLTLLIIIVIILANFLRGILYVNAEKISVITDL